MKPVCLNRLVQSYKRHLLYINTSLKKTSEVTLKNKTAFYYSRDRYILNAMKENASNSC